MIPNILEKHSYLSSIIYVFREMIYMFLYLKMVPSNKMFNLLEFKAVQRNHSYLSLFFPWPHKREWPSFKNGILLTRSAWRDVVCCIKNWGNRFWFRILWRSRLKIFVSVFFSSNMTHELTQSFQWGFFLCSVFENFKNLKNSCIVFKKRFGVSYKCFDNLWKIAKLGC